MKKIYIGADHAGFHLKEQIKNYLKKEQLPCEDLGNLKYDKNDDYPDFGALVAKKVCQTKSKGILICGSSQGICIVANKFKGIRAVSAHTIDEARITRKDNDANILCLAGGQTISGKQKALSIKDAKKIIDVWLHTTISTAKRHHRRIKKIAEIEKKNFK